MKRKNLRRVGALLVTALLGAGIAMAAPADDEVAASGTKWLAFLDDKKYDDSWTHAASMFRDEVKQELWITALKRSREPMGTLVSRATARVDFTKELRGAPEGEYAIIHYTTTFKNKENVTERVTLVKEQGRWQAAAYAIH